MYFRTSRFEYRHHSQRGWQKRKLNTTSWRTLPFRLAKKVQALRKAVLASRNRRATIADNARIILDKRYNEQTKKTTSYAYKYGVPLDNLVTK